MREIIFNILYVLLKNEEHTKGDTTFEVVLDMIQIYSFTFNSSVSRSRFVVAFFNFILNRRISPGSKTASCTTCSGFSTSSK